jgi:hypothetical protein
MVRCCYLAAFFFGAAFFVPHFDPHFAMRTSG